MKGDNAGPVKDTPTSHGVQKFWGTLWGTSVEHNPDAPWITTLRDEYCMNVEQKQYEITDEILNKILSRMANDKPGRDLVCGVWIKRIESIHKPFKQQLTGMLLGEIEPPEWLFTSMTLLLPKNQETAKPQNYRPIALQNAMYKVYTAIIADFIMEHCERNGIVTEEQAAGKRGSWSCADQLLINKMIYEEVVSNRRNLVKCLARLQEGLRQRASQLDTRKSKTCQGTGRNNTSNKSAYV